RPLAVLKASVARLVRLRRTMTPRTSSLRIVARRGGSPQGGPVPLATYRPWQRLNFLPEPHQHGSLRPILALGAEADPAAAPTGVAARFLGSPFERPPDPSSSPGPLSTICPTTGLGAGGAWLRCTCTRKMPGQVLHQSLEVPVLDVAALAGLVDSLLDDVLHVAQDVAARVGALQHLLPLFVDDLALLVHHVVVLDHVLAGVEVHALDLLLRARDGARDPRVLDGLDLEAVHQATDAVGRGTEGLHQV